MSKASPELLRHLDDTPRDELLGWFNVLCRHLALCVDPDGTIHPYDPQFLDMLQILAPQVELVTADAATVREHLLHRLAVCTRELTSGATADPVVVKRWVLACGELVADSVAATLVAANVLDGRVSVPTPGVGVTLASRVAAAALVRPSSSARLVSGFRNCLTINRARLAVTAAPALADPLRAPTAADQR